MKKRSRRRKKKRMGTKTREGKEAKKEDKEERCQLRMSGKEEEE
jgi:hypothetical protein